MLFCPLPLIFKDLMKNRARARHICQHTFYALILIKVIALIHRWQKKSPGSAWIHSGEAVSLQKEVNNAVGALCKLSSLIFHFFSFWPTVLLTSTYFSLKISISRSFESLSNYYKQALR